MRRAKTAESAHFERSDKSALAVISSQLFHFTNNIAVAGRQAAQKDVEKEDVSGKAGFLRTYF
jgi:hypothetical protein